MAEVGWSDEALVQLDLVPAHVEKFDPAAAGKLAVRLIEAAHSQRDFPEGGRHAGGNRRALAGVLPCVTLYTVDGHVVDVTSIRHAARIIERDGADK